MITCDVLSNSVSAKPAQCVECTNYRSTGGIEKVITVHSSEINCPHHFLFHTNHWQIHCPAIHHDKYKVQETFTLGIELRKPIASAYPNKSSIIDYDPQDCIADQSVSDRERLEYSGRRVISIQPVVCPNPKHIIFIKSKCGDIIITDAVAIPRIGLKIGNMIVLGVQNIEPPANSSDPQLSAAVFGKSIDNVRTYAIFIFRVIFERRDFAPVRDLVSSSHHHRSDPYIPSSILMQIGVVTSSRLSISRLVQEEIRVNGHEFYFQYIEAAQPMSGPYPHHTG